MFLPLTWNILTCLDDDHFKWGRKKAVGPPSPSSGQSLCPCMSTLDFPLFSKGQAEALSPTTGLYHLRDNNSFCTGSWGAAGTGLKQQASIFLISQIYKKVWFRGHSPWPIQTKCTTSFPSLLTIQLCSDKEAEPGISILGWKWRRVCSTQKTSPLQALDLVLLILFKRIRADCLPVVNLLQQCSFPVYWTLEML